MALNPLSSGFVVHIQPDRGYVNAGETATFDCDVDTTEPIHHFSWNIEPPMSDTRYTYDNNEKTIHIQGMRASENNTQVTCTATADQGVNMSATAFISLLKKGDDDDGDGGGGDDDGEGGGIPALPDVKTTPKIRMTSVLSTRKRTISGSVTYPSNSPKSATSNIFPGSRTQHAGITLPERPGMAGNESNAATQSNPAIIATLIAIGGLILIGVLVLVVQRLRRKNGRKSHPNQTNHANGRSGMHINNRSYHGGYEVAPIMPIAATIDSRHSQSPDVIPGGHSRHYNPRYAKPIHKGKNHKSLPSLSPENYADEYEYMEPGEQRGRSLAVPFGDGYDHLARSNPESIHQLGLPSSSSTPPNYASLTKFSKNNDKTSYENQHITGSPMFELSEEKRLKYASLNHHDGAMSPPPVKPLTRKTSYAKIRGILRILRTQNSTRVNIEPC